LAWSWLAQPLYGIKPGSGSPPTPFSALPGRVGWGPRRPAIHRPILSHT